MVRLLLQPHMLSRRSRTIFRSYFYKTWKEYKQDNIFVTEPRITKLKKKNKTKVESKLPRFLIYLC